ncbi:MAG TPA: glycosyltransferase, partial [Methylomirabilota bacterium]|nr:glycosyltransferase [Methylomirabilota bacterium]
NSEFHLDTIKSALYLPGYAIFHDSHLKDVFKGELLAHGYITQDRFDAEKALDKAIDNPKTSFLSSVVNNQQALIAHSSYTKDALTESRLDKDPAVLQLNLPTVVPEQLIINKTKQQLTIGLAGIIHQDKGLKEVEAIAQSSDFYDHKIHIFGLSLVSDEVINRLKSYPNVEVDTNITDFQFERALSQLDILINFRPDYKGETSLATIEALRFGVIPVVRKIGWYDELPDDCVLKIEKSDDLTAEIKALIDDPGKRAKMKQAALDFISQNHSYQNYVKNLYDFITQQSLPDNKINRVASEFKTGAPRRVIKNTWEAKDE